MTDDRLLEEILRSPLDDMPERSFERWQIIGGAFVLVLIAGFVGLSVFGGNSDPIDAAAVATTLPGDSTGSTGDAATDATTTTVPPVAAVFPEGNGRFHEMVAVDDGEMLVFGGFIRVDNNLTRPFEGTWRFDVLNGRWSVEEPEIAPSPRFGHAMAYHPPTGRVVVFGGGETTPRPCPRIRFCPGPEDNQVWQYDPATGVWEDMTPADTEAVPWPVPRFGMRFVYEPVTERLITFGGVGVFGDNFTPNFWNDTWAYDPATNEWEDLSTSDEETRPHGAVQYGLVWNEEAERILMFGGDGIPDDPQQVYAFDPATSAWEDLGENEPGEGPTDRWFHAMVPDPQSGRTVMIGGNGSIYRSIGSGFARSNGNIDEVWTWSPAEGWLLQEPLAGDVVAAGVAGDPGTLGIIMYGGGSVWSYEVALDTWNVVWERPEEDA